MRKPKLRNKGEIYRPFVEVLKQKDGTPTSIKINGQQYALVHPHYINGYKSQHK